MTKAWLPGLIVAASGLAIALVGIWLEAIVGIVRGRK